MRSSKAPSLVRRGLFFYLTTASHVLAVHRTLSYIPNQCSTGSNTICIQDCTDAYTSLCAKFPVTAAPLSANHVAPIDQTLTSLEFTNKTCTAKWDVTSRKDIDKGDPTLLQTLRGECMTYFQQALEATPHQSSGCTTNAKVGAIAGYDADDYSRNSDPIVAVYPVGTPGQCFATEHPDPPNSVFGHQTNCDTNVTAHPSRRDLVGGSKRSLQARDAFLDCVGTGLFSLLCSTTCVAASATAILDGGVTAGAILLPCVTCPPVIYKLYYRCTRFLGNDHDKRDMPTLEEGVSSSLKKRSIPTIAGVPMPSDWNPCHNRTQLNFMPSCIQTSLMQACAVS